MSPDVVEFLDPLLLFVSAIFLLLFYTRLSQIFAWFETRKVSLYIPSLGLLLIALGSWLSWETISEGGPLFYLIPRTIFVVTLLTGAVLLKRARQNTLRKFPRNIPGDEE